MSFFDQDEGNSSSSNIRPDEPEMRSVMMGSLAPPPMPMRMGAVPRMPKATRVSASATTKAPQVVLSTTTTSWQPKPLGPVPDVYPLERSHVYVAGGRQQVADRITSHLKSQSIAVTFSETSLEAETADNVRFAINLFAAEDGQIVVEVQRLAGCGFGFRQACRPVLNAAKGSKLPARSVRMARPIPASIRPTPQQESDVRDAVELNVDMLLNLTHLDMHLLAMEGLTQLTRESSTAVHAAKCIFEPESSLLKKIVSLIESFKAEKAKNEDDDLNVFYYEKMHRYALSILGNAVEALLKADDTTTASPLATDSLVQALVRELAFAEERPHDACRAAKCLTCFAKLAPELVFEKVELVEALAIAHKEGVCRHANLESETRELMQRQVGFS
uniref:Uncharacterized protein n=1 Tax=Grammatophora oceanica TaxID=210454 RepID=A0A7S1UNA0_9STRA|mmetsp:Transcript_14052/g.20571  ORF Transcript_14052/g.20571 Transcript_14052/m.20571 type:complete len:389 (+) Transcript_14052:64-1230(+)|eukprot:CAMPEP_0194046536 /NCGR_PEP_ID=MMETSP0009_2-20130614/21515_1 /TAXON_ID=210454 /ORGANISM="Grammatophora oceanica, Strain CCMP 410" /LENGTH=388 /DNA_ID=CAMNT_0038691865 /DNA_START=64 /DNA_END=1230 /DNA_ORIENTATION=-